jgi:hypothetical protein
MKKIILLAAYILLLVVNVALIYEHARWDCEFFEHASTFKGWEHVKYCLARW